MIELNMSSQADRKKLIQDIESSENKGRKAESLRQTEIYNGRIFDHVWARLAKRLDPETLQEMPIVASVNLAKRIADQEASIYVNPPKRRFTSLSEQQEEVVRRIYTDMMFDGKMLQSNRSFKLQSQNHLMIVPRDGQLIMRVLRNHHLDSIDDSNDPESAGGYSVSSIAKDEYIENRKRERGGTGYKDKYDQFVDQDSDGVDNSNGDADDYKKNGDRYLIWTKEFNFIMNGNGEVLSGEDGQSPIPGILPIVDISIEKDFEYWVRQGESLTEFCIEYNSMLSDLNHIMMMQGFAQGVLTGPKSLKTQKMKTGLTKYIFLPVDEDASIQPKFEFLSPNADLTGTISSIEMILSSFLTSKGADPKLISGKGEASKFSSGIERMLSMIEKFESSRSDFDTYQRAEKQVYRVIKEWHNNLIGTGLLKPEYQTSKLPEDSEVEVVFAGPEMLKSDKEKFELLEAKLDQGLISKIDAVMELEGLERADAEERLKQINEDRDKLMPQGIAPRMLGADQQNESNEDS